MRRVLIIFAFLLAVTSVTARNLIKSAINQTSFSTKDFADTIKVKIVNGIVLIPVEIEGSTKHFLLDTGAQFGMWFGAREDWMKPLRYRHNLHLLSSACFANVGGRYRPLFVTFSAENEQH